MEETIRVSAVKEVETRVLEVRTLVCAQIAWEEENQPVIVARTGVQVALRVERPEKWLVVRVE
jgi:hypothetical protein